MCSNTTVYKNEVFADTLENASRFPSNVTMPIDLPVAEGWYELYKLVRTILFSFLICAGLFGNSFIMATLARWREMRTPCNLLIANICAADLGVCIFAAPLRIVETFRGWIFGDVLCHVLTPIQDVLVVVSVVTQTVIALERHRAIVAPFKPKMTQKRVKIAMAVIWLGCYLTAGLPMMFFLENKLSSSGYYICIPDFPNDDYKLSYQMHLVVVFIALPLGIQSIAYFDIIRVLRAKDNSFHSHSVQRKTIKGRIRQKKRLVRMLLVLMLAFQVCYLPRGVIMLLSEFAPEIILENKTEFRYVSLITLVMYYLKHVINPFILWAMSKDFRSSFLSFCPAYNAGLTFSKSSRYQSAAPRQGEKKQVRRSIVQRKDSPVD